jgi:hypothetical protein
MAARQCFHCKQWIEPRDDHDCWTTTEAALTRHLPEDLQEAYERIRDTAVEFGEQRIYASHHSIMFSRKACHFFVRPKSTYLELCLFLGRPIKSPQIKTVVKSSKVKFAHLIRITHRDEVEAPITEWMEEAYRLPDERVVAVVRARAEPRAARKRRRTRTRAR